MPVTKKAVLNIDNKILCLLNILQEVTKEHDSLSANQMYREDNFICKLKQRSLKVIKKETEDKVVDCYTASYRAKYQIKIKD